VSKNLNRCPTHIYLMRGKYITWDEAIRLLGQDYYIEARPRKRGAYVLIRSSDKRDTKVLGCIPQQKVEELRRFGGMAKVLSKSSKNGGKNGGKDTTPQNPPNSNKNTIVSTGGNGVEKEPKNTVVSGENQDLKNILSRILTKLDRIDSRLPDSEEGGGSTPHNLIDPKTINGLLEVLRERDIKEIELKGIEVTGDLIRNDPFIRLYHARARSEIPGYKDVPLPTFLREVVIEFFARWPGWYLSWVDMERFLKSEKG